MSSTPSKSQQPQGPLPGATPQSQQPQGPSSAATPQSQQSQGPPSAAPAKTEQPNDPPSAVPAKTRQPQGPPPASTPQSQQPQGPSSTKALKTRQPQGPPPAATPQSQEPQGLPLATPAKTQKKKGSPSAAPAKTQKRKASPSAAPDKTQKRKGSPSAALAKTQKRKGSPSAAPGKTQQPQDPSSAVTPESQQLQGLPSATPAKTQKKKGPPSATPAKTQQPKVLPSAAPAKTQKPQGPPPPATPKSQQPQRGPPTPQPKKYPFLGILLAVIASLIFSICGVIVKSLVNIPSVELSVFRFLGIFVPSIPIVILTHQPFFPKGYCGTLLLRCIIGTIALMCTFYAFRNMPLADASVIICSAPVFVAIFEWILNHVPCKLFNIVTIVLSLFGVVLITHPTFIFGKHAQDKSERYDVWAPLAAFGAMTCNSCVFILLHAMRRVHFAVLMLNFGAFGLVFTSALCVATSHLVVPSSSRESCLIAALTVLSFLGQMTLTFALKLENAGPISIARCCDILFAFIWQTLFFNEPITIYLVAGGLLVIICVVATALKK